MSWLPSGVPSLVSHHWCPIADVPTSVSQGRTQGAALASFLSIPCPWGISAGFGGQQHPSSPTNIPATLVSDAHMGRA